MVDRGGFGGFFMASSRREACKAGGFIDRVYSLEPDVPCAFVSLLVVSSAGTMSMGAMLSIFVCFARMLETVVVVVSLGWIFSPRRFSKASNSCTRAFVLTHSGAVSWGSRRRRLLTSCSASRARSISSFFSAVNCWMVR